ncbi:MAG: hypothetical protein ACO295_00425 [Sediminibacterium sp.]
MAEKKHRHSLLSRYKKLCKQNNISESINIYVEQWAADSLIESYGLDSCYEMLEYYFKVSETPSWKWFVNNAEKVHKNLTGKKEDDRIRELLRKQAKEWLNK